MSLFNSLLRRQILNQRYILNLQKQNKRELMMLLERISMMIAKQPNVERLQAIKADIELALTNGFAKFNAKVSSDLVAFALDENEFTGQVVRANSKALLRVPDAQSVELALKTGFMDIGTKQFNLNLGQAIEQFSEGQAFNIRSAIKDGILFGQTTKEISGAIQALADSRTAAQVEALTRTSVNFATGQVRKNFAQANADIFDGEEYVAVLDKRTTTLCGGLDGNIYKIGEGVYPPTHWNCRSIRVPVMKKEFAKGNQRSKRENFDEWLRDQNDDFQDEYFAQFPDGAEKAKLFRKGGLEIQQYRDSKGRNYSLDELKSLYPLAIDKAGI